MKASRRKTPVPISSTSSRPTGSATAKPSRLIAIEGVYKCHTPYKVLKFGPVDNAERSVYKCHALLYTSVTPPVYKCHAPRIQVSRPPVLNSLYWIPCMDKNPCTRAHAKFLWRTPSRKPQHIEPFGYC